MAIPPATNYHPMPERERPYKPLKWRKGMSKNRLIIKLSSSLLLLAIAPLSKATVQSSLFSSGLERPVFLTGAPGDRTRLFVAEQHTGQIKIINPNSGKAVSTPFLTVPGITTGSEQGLLGFTFHPNYQRNGKFYVNFTRANETHVVEYKVSSNPNIAQPSPIKTIISYSQPFSNHNGGWIGFGPKDGYLYISSGDGGFGNDPGNRAQDFTEQKLGKILRIDVDGDDFIGSANDPNNIKNYAIPVSNPFVGEEGDDEIWALGLRNPWRPSFDSKTGDFYIADVGQDAREEINFQLAESPGGENYGWRLREGLTATPGVGGPLPEGVIDPIYEYLHESNSDGGFSITGGYVYRGALEELDGKYFFADFVSEQIWSIEHNGIEVTSLENWTETLNSGPEKIGSISSFGEDLDGNLYILDLNDGEIFVVKAVPVPAAFVLFLSGILGFLPLISSKGILKKLCQSG